MALPVEYEIALGADLAVAAIRLVPDTDFIRLFETFPIFEIKLWITGLTVVQILKMI